MFSSSASQVSTAANYIEDVFSTYLYTGSDSAQSISNGIDLATKGGMVWIKNRPNATDHYIVDSSRISGGDYGMLNSNSTAAQSFQAGVSSFDSGGFSLDGNVTQANRGGYGSYASWTFRKQAKFFDVVTFTAPSSGVITVNHNLGSAPGCVITKATGISQFWIVNHRSLASTKYLVLDTNAGEASAGALTYTATATTVTFSAGYLTANTNYIMYLFAHDAGGFGAAGTDNVISCGSLTMGSSAVSVNLGYEPQWILAKDIDLTSDWTIMDNMRGLPALPSNGAAIYANLSSAEVATNVIQPTSIGFTWNTAYSPGNRIIYIACRRGPMKTPTSGTSVFQPFSYTGDGTTRVLSSSSPLVQDMWIAKRKSEIQNNMLGTRLAGVNTLFTNLTNAEDNFGAIWDYQGVKLAPNYWTNASGISYVNYAFRRAPGFFDVVCYTGTGVTRTVTHNLTAVPELLIVRNRNVGNFWYVYSAPTGNTKRLLLDQPNAAAVDNPWNNTSPTASVFTVIGSNDGVNYSGYTYVAYLFATVAGVSKVGSYTGTAALQTINCAFTSGARFVLIKRTDSTGDWYVWDSARGISSGNDPYLLLNSTAAEVTGTNYVDTTSVGFQVTAAAPAGINASGGSYIFLAVS